MYMVQVARGNGRYAGRKVFVGVRRGVAWLLEHHTSTEPVVTWTYQCERRSERGLNGQKAGAHLRHVRLVMRVRRERDVGPRREVLRTYQHRRRQHQYEGRE